MLPMAHVMVIDDIFYLRPESFMKPDSDKTETSQAEPRARYPRQDFAFLPGAVRALRVASKSQGTKDSEIKFYVYLDMVVHTHTRLPL